MKKTVDGESVSARSWYFLLDWNENDNWQTIDHQFKTTKLSELRKEQFIALFRIAVNQELAIMKNTPELNNLRAMRMVGCRTLIEKHDRSRFSSTLGA